MAFDLDSVHKDIRKLRSFLKRWPKHAPPGQVHFLRTAIRRFEAAMQALALESNANERRLLRELAKLGKRAGKVRDLDVLTGYAVDLKIGDEEDCLIQLLEYLGSEHAYRSQRLYAYADEHGESLRRGLMRTASHLKPSSDDAPPSQTSPGHAMLSELRLQRELTEPVRLTKTNLHTYRLQVKELRYMLEMEKDPADQGLIEILGQIKDAIGEWHDWQELLAIAREQLSHGSKCKLLEKIQTTTDEKLKRAIVVANEGRQLIQPPPTGTEDTA